MNQPAPSKTLPTKLDHRAQVYSPRRQSLVGGGTILAIPAGNRSAKCGTLTGSVLRISGSSDRNIISWFVGARDPKSLLSPARLVSPEVRGVGGCPPDWRVLVGGHGDELLYNKRHNPGFRAVPLAY